MAYTNISELPTEVLNALDDVDAEQWMQAYNSQDPQTEDEVIEAKRYAWTQCRELPSSFSFDIIASVEDVDSDGELISIEPLKEQMDSFIKQGGTVQDEHGNYRVAHIYDWDDYTDPETGYPGILVHGNVFGGRGENMEYAKARQDFIDGKNNLSIAGDASVEGYECDEGRCYVRRNMMQLMEISLVSQPANPYATLQWYNDKAVVKSGTPLKVKNVKVHKSYNECDLQKMAKILKAYDPVVTRYGVTTRIRNIEHANRLVKGIGRVCGIEGKGVIVDSYARILEREFKKSYRTGECNANGILMADKLVKGRFGELCAMRIIKKGINGWAFNRHIVTDEIAKKKHSFKTTAEPKYEPIVFDSRNDYGDTGYLTLDLDIDVNGDRATGTGGIAISFMDLYDDDAIQEEYDRIYAEYVTSVKDDYDMDDGEQEKIAYSIMHDRNMELDDAFDTMQLTLRSIDKITIFKIKADTYDDGMTDVNDLVEDVRVKATVDATLSTGHRFTYEVEFDTMVGIDDDTLWEIESAIEIQNGEI